MRDIFTPIFLLALAVLCLLHGLGPSPFIFPQLGLAAFVLFLVFFFLKKYRPAYAAVALALVLLLGGSFMRRKSSGMRGRSARCRK